MNLRSIGTHLLGAAVILASIAVDASAQASGNAQASSATHVLAEMTAGKLNPAESKPGDEVALRLKEDAKSNGQVVLRKGTMITGLVRSVKRAEGKSDANGQAHSMMEIEWLTPAAQGRPAHQLSIAVQSVTQVSPLHRHGQNAASGDNFGLVSAGSAAGSVGAPARSSSSGGLPGGAPGATTGAVGGTMAAASGVGSTAGAVGSASSRSSGQSNAALLNMPSVAAVDVQTSSSIESSLGMPSSGRLFKTGRGELVSAGGAKQPVELFSHLNNDTVITSQNKNFEISSGAQMQLLVGVNKKQEASK